MGEWFLLPAISWVHNNTHEFGHTELEYRSNTMIRIHLGNVFAQFCVTYNGINT